MHEINMIIKLTNYNKTNLYKSTNSTFYESKICFKQQCVSKVVNT